MTDATTTADALAAIERTLELDAPRARVWGAITDPAELSRWFPQRAEWDLRPGGTGTFFWEGYGSFPIEVVSVEEPGYLAWRWGMESDEVTLVEWWLDERPDGGTTLRMRESGFTTPKHRAGNDEGWTEELGELEAMLAERAA
jgi:uncharacterized protein YndB with AHSA1/START domain